MVNKPRASAITRSDDSLLSVRRTALSLAVAAALPGAMVLPNVAVAQSDDVIEEVSEDEIGVERISDEFCGMNREMEYVDSIRASRCQRLLQRVFQNI